MLVSKIVYIDILTPINISSDTKEKDRNLISKVIDEMNDFGFKYSECRRTQITRDGMVGVFNRITFLTPTEEPVMLPDSYVTELLNIMALVRLPHDDDSQAPKPDKEIYLDSNDCLCLYITKGISYLGKPVKESPDSVLTFEHNKRIAETIVESVNRQEIDLEVDIKKRAILDLGLSPEIVHGDPINEFSTTSVDTARSRLIAIETNDLVNDAIKNQLDDLEKQYVEESQLGATSTSEIRKTDVVSKHWPRGLTPYTTPIDESPYIEIKD
jgi:hypothetical protein